MRKQYHFRPGARRLDAWDVDRLVGLARDLPVREIPVAGIEEVDRVYWSETMTPRQVGLHARLIREVDPQHPIILGADGRVMDGMHRVLRALDEGRATIAAVRFEVDPEPDHRDVVPEELDYTDEDSGGADAERR